VFLHVLIFFSNNPSFQQYEFWPLMLDATFFVQHLCSIVIFICCFVGITQELVSPAFIATWGTLCTIFGWALCDFWSGQEDNAAKDKPEGLPPSIGSPDSSFSTRNQQRLATAKSAILICFAVLGLSPVLKSMTNSVYDDSIRAMSCFRRRSVLSAFLRLLAATLPGVRLLGLRAWEWLRNASCGASRE